MSNSLPYSVSTENGRTDRLDDQIRLWKHVSATALRQDVDAIFILGDLVDNAMVDPITLRETVKAMMSLPRPVYFLPGNHDAASISGDHFVVEAFAEMRRKSFKVIGMDDKPIEIGGWLKFWPLAFCPTSEAERRIALMRDEAHGDSVNVLLLHHSINGAENLGWKCDDGLDGESISKHFDLVLSGHFHTHQRIGKGPGMYLGAPMQHHFGDSGRTASYWVISFSDSRRIVCSAVNPMLPRFYTHQSLEVKTKAKRGDYVRYEISATHPDWTVMLPKAHQVVQALRGLGIHADYKHKPIYQHKERIDTSSTKDEFGTVRWNDAISSYVDASDVLVGDMDMSELKRVGRSIMDSVRDGHGHL